MNSQTVSTGSRDVDGALSPRAHVAEDDPGGDRGDDPGQADLVGQDVAAVGEHDGDRQLDQVVVGDEADHPGRGVPGREADDDADHDGPDEGRDGLDRADRRVDGADCDREQDETGPVVEQALAVDHRGQRLRDRQALERGDDRRGIGRRHHRPDDEREIGSKAGRDAQDDRDDGRRDDDARDGEQGQAADPAPDLDDPEPVRGLEHEARQEHQEDELGRDVDGRVAGDAREKSDTEARDDEGDGVREPQRPDDDRDEDRETEQADEQLEDVWDVLVDAGRHGNATSVTSRPWSV